MNKYLLALLSGCTAPIALQAPVGAAPIAQSEAILPAEVRATLPRGATSFLLQRLSIGPGSSKMLVHIWASTRPNTPDSQNSYNRFSASPFCVDIFAPQLNEKGRWRWHLKSSAAFIQTDAPSSLQSYWLEPAKKQGAVLHITSSNGAPGVSTQHTLLVWDKGFRAGYPAPRAQILASGGSGGGLVSLDFSGVDRRGIMSIKMENSFAGKVQSTAFYGWNGKCFAPAEDAR